MITVKLKTPEEWADDPKLMFSPRQERIKSAASIQADTLLYAAALIKEWHQDNTLSVIRSLEEQANALKLRQ